MKGRRKSALLAGVMIAGLPGLAAAQTPGQTAVEGLGKLRVELLEATAPQPRVAFTLALDPSVRIDPRLPLTVRMRSDAATQVQTPTLVELRQQRVRVEAALSLSAQGGGDRCVDALLIAQACEPGGCRDVRSSIALQMPAQMAGREAEFRVVPHCPDHLLRASGKESYDAARRAEGNLYRALWALAPTLRACYAGSKSRMGRVPTFDLQLDAAGRSQAPRVQLGADHDAAVAECLQGALGKLELPALRDEAIVLRWPYMQEPTRSD